MSFFYQIQFSYNASIKTPLNPLIYSTMWTLMAESLLQSISLNVNYSFFKYCNFIPLGILYSLVVHHLRRAAWKTLTCVYATTNTPSRPRSRDPLLNSYRNSLAKGHKIGHVWTVFWMTNSSLVGFSLAPCPQSVVWRRPNLRLWKTGTTPRRKRSLRGKTDCTSRRLIPS